MSTTTTNYSLVKIAGTDSPPNIEVINPNWDTVDTKLKEAADHAAGTVKHTTAEERAAWNSKAAGNHNHDTNYAPIAHSNNEDIHVTTNQKTAWNNKADSDHSHTLASLAAAPSGFGVGENVVNNRISNPLDLTLKTGIYGFTTYQGSVQNSPLTNMLGHVEVYAFSGVWHYVKAVDHDSGSEFFNRYDENDRAWTGWYPINKPRVMTTTVEKTMSPYQGFPIGDTITPPKCVIVDSSIEGGTTRILYPNCSSLSLFYSGVGNPWLSAEIVLALNKYYLICTQSGIPTSTALNLTVIY